MASRHQNVRHVFEGGWAPDFGPVASVAPGGSTSSEPGVLHIPWLVNAQDLEYELDGAIHKLGGLTKLNTSALASGAPVRGLYDYWHTDAFGSVSQSRIAVAGTVISADDGNGTFTQIFSGMTLDAIPAFETFDNLFIHANGVDNPKSWNGTTAQDLSATAPRFAFMCVHKGRLWAAGDRENPSSLYYSVAFDPTDFIGATSGVIQIDPGDGDAITAIASHKNDLWVFKGPNKGSIHRITGSAPTGADGFANVPFIRSLGAVSHNTLFRYQDDLGFMWADGSIRSLAATAAYGDFNEATLSRGFNKYLRAHINSTKLPRAWAAGNSGRGQVRFTLNVDASDENNVMLIMDHRFTPPRWSYLRGDTHQATALATVKDSSQGGLSTIMSGGTDGFVRRMDQATRSIDGTGALSMKATTPYINYGEPFKLKHLAYAGLGIAPFGNMSVTFSWRRDNQALQTTSVTQGGGDVLGPSAVNPFTLNTSTLSGGFYTDRWVDMTEGGEFHAIQYEVTQAGVNEDAEVHGFSTSLEVGTESLEIQ